MACELLVARKSSESGVAGAVVGIDKVFYMGLNDF